MYKNKFCLSVSCIFWIFRKTKNIWLHLYLYVYLSICYVVLLFAWGGGGGLMTSFHFRVVVQKSVAQLCVRRLNNIILRWLEIPLDIWCLIWNTLPCLLAQTNITLLMSAHWSSYFLSDKRIGAPSSLPDTCYKRSGPWRKNLGSDGPRSDGAGRTEGCNEEKQEGEKRGTSAHGAGHDGRTDAMAAHATPTQDFTQKRE